MNIKISINMTILSMLSEFEHAQAENKSQLCQDLLYQLVSLSKSLPYPASGHTYQLSDGNCLLKLQGMI